MSKANSLSDIYEIEQDRAPEARCASEQPPVTPDPIMLEKIGKGLHELYDRIPESTLPIYFGPVLGELYLTPMPHRRSV